MTILGAEAGFEPAVSRLSSLASCLCSALPYALAEHPSMPTGTKGVCVLSDDGAHGR